MAAARDARAMAPLAWILAVAVLAAPGGGAPANVAVPAQSTIPKILVTSHALPLDRVPAALSSSIDKWVALNPDFKLKYFDDIEQAAWMRDHCAVAGCVAAYEKLSSGAGRADLFRVAYLYFAGGWWFDADLKPGGIAASCGLGAAEDSALFVLREPKRGHIRFMLIAGNGHPLLLANLYRQIANIEAAKALPKARQPRTLHVTGPFTLGHSLCAPLEHAPAAALFVGAPPPGLDAAVASIAENCENGLFRGRPARDPAPGEVDWTNPSADWAMTYGDGTPLAFRFDGCRGTWHRPGGAMPYAAVLAAMNVTHHLKTSA